MTDLLRKSFRHFARNPIAESLLTGLFLLAACTGILLGPAAVLYLWHHNPQIPDTPMRAILLSQRLQNTHRLPAAFWCGLIIWIFAILPGLAHPVFGLSLWMIAVQPVWMVILLSDRFDLPLNLAGKTVFTLFQTAPRTALQLLLLGIIAFSGILLFGIGIFITLPVAVRAMHLLLDSSPTELASAVQQAYRL